MDLKQIKDDLKEGKIVSKTTWMKLLEAAIIQEEGLQFIANMKESYGPLNAIFALEKVRIL